MTTSKSDRPLVTFALFAYNQEQYIREAVEGAFSQTYEPLEIILSDDCSRDQTYEIMEEMVAAYKGPHNVLIRRSIENRGLTSHINAVAEISTGEILVLAAGDDVSAPERTEIVMKGFRSIPALFAVYSDFNEIDSPAKPVFQARTRRDNIFEIIFNGGGIGKGATYAYRRECFFWPRQIPPVIFSEDKLLPARAALLGDVYFIDKQLVMYRRPPNRLGERLKKDGLVALKRPEHIASLSYELALAVQQGKIGVAKLWLLKGILGYRRFTVMEVSSQPKPLRLIIKFFQRVGRSVMRSILRLLSTKRTVVLDK